MKAAAHVLAALALVNSVQAAELVRLHTDRPGFVSLNVFRADGSIARHLLAAEHMDAGDHEIPWDGRADAIEGKAGEMLPAGEYMWRAVFHEGIGLRLRGWACGGGGVWSGVCGLPAAVAADGARVFLGWSGGGKGTNVLACDLQGRALWASPPDAVGCCESLAADGGAVYVLGGAHAESSQGGTAVYRLRAEDGAELRWPDGQSALRIADLWPADGKSKPSRADAMEARNGRLYLSFTKDEFMAVLDAKSGAYLQTVVGAPPGPSAAVPTKTDFPGKPGVLEDADFVVTALKGAVLGKLLLAHDPLWVVASELTPLEGEERITAMTMLGDGAKFHQHEVFVGLAAPVNQVQARSILESEGFLYVAGKTGGRDAPGPWVPNRMRNIHGVALDAEGKLWVAERDAWPPRFSVWTTEGREGKVVREIFGPAASAGGAIFPGSPDIMAGQGCEWRIDPKTGDGRCLGVITRDGMDVARFCASPDGRIFLAVIHARAAGAVSIYERLGDGDYRLRSQIAPSLAGEHAETISWCDENGDGDRQPAEMQSIGDRLRCVAVEDDLTLRMAGDEAHGFVLKVARWSGSGAPRHDLSQLAPIRDAAQGAAEVLGALRLAPKIGTARMVAGGAGDWELRTDDGFFLARFFDGGAEQPVLRVGADMTHARSGAFGSVVQAVGGKAFVQAGRGAMWDMEVTGLDTIRALPGGKLVLRAGGP
jgi:hypothetical protein